MKKVIVAGGRDFDDFFWFEFVDFLEYHTGDQTFEIISGGAKGADALAEKYAKTFEVPITVFKADWERHGKAAGPIRNEQMAEVGDILVAYLAKKPSRGTSDMINKAIKHGLEIHIYRYDNSTRTQ